MGAYFQAEKLKNRHTFLWGLTILMPLVCSLLSAQLTHRYFAMAGYNWWYMMMMPGFLTIICGLVGGKDLKKQNRTIGSLPADTGKIWDAKVLLCAVASGMATFALTVFVFFGTLLLKDGLHMVFINPPSFWKPDPGCSSNLDHVSLAASLLSFSDPENRSFASRSPESGCRSDCGPACFAESLVFSDPLWDYPKSDVSGYKNSS